MIVVALSVLDSTGAASTAQSYLLSNFRELSISYEPSLRWSRRSSRRPEHLLVSGISDHAVNQAPLHIDLENRTAYLFSDNTLITSAIIYPLCRVCLVEEFLQADAGLIEVVATVLPGRLVVGLRIKNLKILAKNYTPNRIDLNRITANNLFIYFDNLCLQYADIGFPASFKLKAKTKILRVLLGV